MQDLLQAHPDLKGVYAQNDDMALGAMQVLAENNRTDVKVFGVDGLMEAVRAIADGDQYVATPSTTPTPRAGWPSRPRPRSPAANLFPNSSTPERVWSTSPTHPRWSVSPLSPPSSC